MGSRYGVSLSKRANLLGPIGAMKAVDLAQWALGARRPAPPEAAAEDAGERRSLLYGTLVNLGAVLIVAGLASVVSALLFTIPPGLFVAAFVAVCCYLLLAGTRAAAQGSWAAGSLFAWAALAFALVVFAGAQLAGLTGFVPDLVLVWLAGVLAFALAVPGSRLLTVSCLGVIAWTALAYLFGRPYVAAVAALVALFWAALRRPVSRPFVGALTLATVTVATAYVHDIVRPGHYPLAPGAGELLFALAAVGAAGALWAVAVALKGTAGAGDAVISASRGTVRACGHAVLGLVAVRPLWEAVQDRFQHTGAPLTAGIALLAFTAILMWSTPTSPGDRLVFFGSVVRFFALAGALYDVPPGLGNVAPLLAVAALGLVAYRVAARGATRGDPVRVLTGVLLMVIVAGAALVFWRGGAPAAAPVLVAAGLLTVKVARDWNRGLADDTDTEAGPELEEDGLIPLLRASEAGNA
ncbi:hypothetical protein J4573_40180 [Actinomadura barringtoniae]|uniref:DUF2157 domain-containing protein n=1 Tax=Actinomadura barringtoniae TaxID=1427535 RepID=A0A939TBB0_9ACTN|nr:hypothetical protein [Actinomadura barringtoniae]MBO2453367.1 hypothetical protein [Actinomadura barringtoniae]